MRVILDTSLNHTGSDSVYFDRYSNFPARARSRAAKINSDSPYADWYTFFPDKTQPDQQYTGWVGASTAGADRVRQLQATSPSASRTR